MSKSDTVPVGRITGPHGIRGEVKVYVYGDADFPYKEVYIEGRSNPLKVIKARPHKGVVIVEFKGLGDRNEAERLAGAELFVPSSELPGLEPGEYYHADLIGMEVRALDFVPEVGASAAEGEGGPAMSIGTVRDVISTGSNDVLEVDGPFGEVLVPVIPGVVEGIDVDEGLITVRLPEGLIETGGKGPGKDVRGGGGRARGRGKGKAGAKR